MTGTNTVLTEKLWRQKHSNDSIRKPKRNTKQEKQTERNGGTRVWSLNGFGCDECNYLQTVTVLNGLLRKARLEQE